MRTGGLLLVGVLLTAIAVLVVAILAISGELPGTPDPPGPNAYERAMAGEPPDLEVTEGTPGYFDWLGTEGAQRHYHALEANFTFVAGDFRLGEGTAALIVATYDGPARRTVPENSLRPYRMAVLVVRVVDESGERQSNVRVTVCGKPLDSCLGHYEVGWCGDGEVTFRLPPGHYGIEAGGAERRWVAIRNREFVFCTLGPSALRVDSRAVQ